METKNQNIEWLMGYGSPAIRIRTMKDIIGENPSQKMIDDLLAFPMTEKWLPRLQPKTDFFNLHGSKPECLENVSGKLHELGYSVSMSPKRQHNLDNFVEVLEDIGRTQALFEFSTLFIYASLLILDFDHPLLLDMAVDHLTMVGDFCHQMDYDIHIDPDTFGGMYASYHGRKLLNPEFNHRLPTIWDLYLLAYMPRTRRKEEINQAETSILNYILTDDYQNLPEGYGIMYHPPTKKYFAHGWNIGLPGWHIDGSISPTHQEIQLQRLELFANFPSAHSRKWFQNSVNHFESFQTTDGTYRFPSGYLKEGTSGYFVFGNYMRLEENRRRKIALELDSTFRMELIKKRASRG